MNTIYDVSNEEINTFLEFKRFKSKKSRKVSQNDGDIQFFSPMLQNGFLGRLEPARNSTDKRYQMFSKVNSTEKIGKTF